jgi:O-antigen/teichoic acid export membrane protein
MSILAKTKQTLRTDFVKVSVWSGVATGIKMATSLVLSKLLATTVGTAGVALIGQLLNGVAIFLNLSNGAIHMGITKYTAEYENQPEKRQQLFNTSLVITLFCSLITGLLLVIFNRPISQYLLNSSQYGNIVVIIGATLWLYALNINLMAIANGLKQYRTYIVANTASSLLGLLFTFMLVKTAGLTGALLAGATYQSMVVFVTAGLIYHRQKNLYFKGWSFNKAIGRQLLAFSAMSLVSALILPWSQIAVRNLITNRIDIHAAGLWESMNRISFAYLSLITMGIQTYIIPKMSAIHGRHLLRREVGQTYQLVLPVLIVMCVGMYLCRDLIIRVLFTPAFLEIRHLFAWQLTGDFVKIAGWLMGLLFWAKGMTKWFIATELFFPLQYLFLTHLCLPRYGLQGACIAHFINYCVYFVVVYAILRGRKIL